MNKTHEEHRNALWLSGDELIWLQQIIFLTRSLICDGEVYRDENDLEMRLLKGKETLMKIELLLIPIRIALTEAQKLIDL